MQRRGVVPVRGSCRKLPGDVRQQRKDGELALKQQAEPFKTADRYSRMNIFRQQQ